MLRKLIKHEFLATRRLLIPVNLTVIAITIIGCIILSTRIFQHENSMPLAVFLILFYVLSLMVLSFVSSIYLLVRFYKNLFTAEGYLMFTLPVTPVQLLNSKLITGYLWSFINILIIMASIFALSFTGGFYSTGSARGIEEFFSLSINGSPHEVISFQNVFGRSASELLILCILTVLIRCFFSLTMGYISIALGQLIEKYKLVCSIAFYIAFYVGTQIIASVIMIISNINIISGNIATDPWALSRSIYGPLLPTTCIMNLVLGVLFYVITILVMRKKINLD